MADAIVRAMRADSGSLLAFLPGAAEIRRTAGLLDGRLDAAVEVVSLYGALGPHEQDRAIAPAPPGRRKIVLATAIAETSLTIEGVRIVVDSGLARIPRYEPDVGVTRLETVRVSRAAADQRRGRAGRTQPGICYRLWDEPQTASLEAFSRPEILVRRSVIVRARSRRMGFAPWATRLSRSAAARCACGSERVAAPRLAPSTPTGASPTRAAGCEACRCRRGWRGWWSTPPPRAPRSRPPKSRYSSASAALAATTSILRTASRPFAATARRAPAMRARWRSAGPGLLPLTSRRDGAEPTYRRDARSRLSGTHRQKSRRPTGAFLLANGRGAQIDPKSRACARALALRLPNLPAALRPPASCRPRRLRLADIEARFAGRITASEETAFDPASASLRRRRLRWLGAIALAEQPLPAVADETAARTLAEGVARLGIDRLPWTRGAAAMARPRDVPATRRRRRMARPFRCRAVRRYRLACRGLRGKDGAERAFGRRIRRRT